MDNSMIWVWLGVSICVIGGIAGSGFGIYKSIKNTNGPRERDYVIKASIVSVFLVVIFLICLLLIEQPFNHSDACIFSSSSKSQHSSISLNKV